MGKLAVDLAPPPPDLAPGCELVHPPGHYATECDDETTKDVTVQHNSVRTGRHFSSGSSRQLTRHLENFIEYSGHGPVTFPIDDHYNVLAPTLKIYPTIFFLIHSI